MTYNKPEVLKLDSALSAIQGTEKPFIPPHRDSLTGAMDATPAAYESDE